MEAHDSPAAILWAERYARRSGVTVEWLRQHGREVRECRCGEKDCQGWQMAHISEETWWRNREAFDV